MSAQADRHQTLKGGFNDPVFQAQTVFRSVMQAMARPGTIFTVEPDVLPPSPLTPMMAAIACTLMDADTPVFLDDTINQSVPSRTWLTFQTGAPLTTAPNKAAFALIADPSKLYSFSGFAIGTQEYPETSTTLILNCKSLEDGPRLTLTGPGIQDRQPFYPFGLSNHFTSTWTENGKLFPLGCDLIFACGNQLACLPRTTQISIAGD